MSVGKAAILSSCMCGAWRLQLLNFVLKLPTIYVISPVKCKLLVRQCFFYRDIAGDVEIAF